MQQSQNGVLDPHDREVCIKIFAPSSHSDEGKPEAKAPSLMVATLSEFDMADGFKPVISSKMIPGSQ